MTLSDKITEYYGIPVKDVKEFIRKLKEDGCECKMHPKQIKALPEWKCWFCVMIKKHIGDKLTN